MTEIAKSQKTNRAGDKHAPPNYDMVQTPMYAVDPLLGYINPKWRIWEPAAGAGNIVRRLRRAGLSVRGTDILNGHDFFAWQPRDWDCLITNPPYSSKYDWLLRCYQLGRPFALLLPVEVLGAARAQRLFKTHGIRVILLDKRINFYMPDQGYEGGGAWFPTAWFTWQWGLAERLNYACIHRYPDKQLPLPGRDMEIQLEVGGL